MSSKDSVKEDNDVISMKRERSELESQVNDLRIQLTQLQTEVTSLENRKTMLETIHGSYVSESKKTGQMNRRGVGVDSDVDLEITKTITEVTKIKKVATSENSSFVTPWMQKHHSKASSSLNTWETQSHKIKKGKNCSWNSFSHLSSVLRFKRACLSQKCTDDK